jgi:hypothetical protein
MKQRAEQVRRLNKVEINIGPAQKIRAASFTQRLFLVSSRGDGSLNRAVRPPRLEDLPN